MTTTITLDLTDQEIAHLRAGALNQQMFTKPGLNFQEITDEAVQRSAAATSLVNKVNAAIGDIESCSQCGRPSLV